MLPNPDNSSVGHLFGTFREGGALPIQQPYERLDLDIRREFHVWEPTGRPVGVRAAFDRLWPTLAIAINDRGTRREANLRLQDDVLAQTARVLGNA